MRTATHTGIATLMTVFLANCAAMDDETRTKLEGAVGGAVAAAAICKAMGKDPRYCAALGGVVGTAVASEIAARKKKYASKEDFLNGEIQRLAEYNKSTREYNHRLEKDIQMLEQNVASLEKKIQHGTAKKSSLNAKHAEIQQHIKNNKIKISELQKEYEINVAILEEQNKSKQTDNTQLERLRQEVALLKKNIDALQESNRQLAKIDQRLPL